MNKIKDFIYDKSDIVIALLILVVAAGIIFWRVDAILKYPKMIPATPPQSESVPPSVDNEGENTDNETTGNKTDNNDSEDNENTTANKDSKDNQSGNKPKDNKSSKDNSQSQEQNSGSNTSGKEIWQGNTLARDIGVNVQGNTATQAIQCLIDAGLFNDYDEYHKICDKIGLDHEKVKAGYMTFDKGSTKADIARAMNWG